jgi:hypothetical protein
MNRLLEVFDIAKKSSYLCMLMCYCKRRCKSLNILAVVIDLFLDLDFCNPTK